ncbi:L,D-transpeptidase [Nocardioides panacisoli]|uniref:L,D-transpeptidase n=1 Tax=Nocardioides panacisoli TaxID=627624 RepID=UPI001C62A01B|nr:L,D-transpeptidase [Nocardioides panacisoli]QYJ05508.1 L,D-transpeptidase [Nocardioides panacisoli]
MTETTQRRSTWPEATVIVVLLLAALVYYLGGLGGGDDGAADTGPETVTLSAAELRQLTASTTHTTVSRAPGDDARRPTDGTIVHPRKVTPVFDAPGGDAIAKVRRKEFGDLWLPVIDERSGWLRVMLPSRPNGSTGWIQDRNLERATTRYLVRVHTGSRTVELFRDDQRLGEWTVAVGAQDSPTPSGRTFVLGQFSDTQQSFSPVIIPLGMHSDTLDTYGGGPGTVAFHGWGDSSVFGQAVSHGCIRVPDEALEQLRAVPLGTTVLIDDK